jgi:hypothetical protein
VSAAARELFVRAKSNASKTRVDNAKRVSCMLRAAKQVLIIRGADTRIAT